MASEIPPWLDDSDRVLVYIYRPSLHDIHLTLPPLVPKVDGIAACLKFNETPRTTSRKVSFSYKDMRQDPAALDLPRGLICPNCTSHQTAFGHMRVVKGVKHPMFYYMNCVVFRMYPINPCIALFRLPNKR